MYKKIFFLFSVITSICILAHPSFAQRHDYMTDEEIDIVRDAQQIDQRIDVLMHAVDRRFSALGITLAGTVSTGKKESEKWGAAPTGTRLQLLTDIKKILQKAVDDINNLSERPDSMVLDETDKKAKASGYKDVFPKAVRNLAAAAVRFEPALHRELDATKDQIEKGALIDSLDLCNEIKESVKKLPAEIKKEKN